MKTTRRQFLKALLSTAGTAIVAPQVLVETAHGASDLTPQERDIAAQVMGLRKRQWTGYTFDRDDTLHYTFQADGPGWRRVTVPIFKGIAADGSPLFGEMTFKVDLGESIEDAMNRARSYTDPLPPLRAVWTDDEKWIEPGPAMLFGRPVEWISRTEVESAIIDALNEEAQRQSREWEREFLEGVSCGKKPVGILRL